MLPAVVFIRSIGLNYGLPVIPGGPWADLTAITGTPAKGRTDSESIAHAF
jgi:hypothetical protein